MPEPLNDAVLQFALAALGLAVVAITGYLLPLLRAKVGAARFDHAVDAISHAVKAAEQLYGSDNSAAKLDYVTTYAEHHVPYLTSAQRKTLIESAVHGLQSIAVAVEAPSVPTATSVVTAPQEAPKPRRRRSAATPVAKEVPA